MGHGHMGANLSYFDFTLFPRRRSNSSIIIKYLNIEKVTRK